MFKIFFYIKFLIYELAPLILFVNAVSAQEISLSGIVSDSLGKPLEWVNIGIKDKNIGTVSNSEGQFTLAVPGNLGTDSLTFSFVGYKVVDIAIKDIHVKKSLNITLYNLPVQLNTVSIFPKKRKRRTLGIKGYTPFVWAAITALNINDVYEQARLVKIDKPSRILSVNVRSKGDQDNKDSIMYRLNIYAVKNGYPGERLIERSFIKTFPLSESTFSFDLSEENIFIDEDCVVSFEFLPKTTEKQPPRVSLRAKLGGSGGFTRRSSLGIWEKMQGASASIFLEVEQ